MDNARYSCQIALSGFGQKAQSKLKQSKVLIVGMGGLGCPASLYLTSMGVGILGIVDFDTVSSKNLHRQVLYGQKDLGKQKVQIAKKALRIQNPDIKINVYDKKLTANNAPEIIKKYDIVLDCTDNFETRYLLNDTCVLAGKPLVYGAIFQYEGQVAIWNLNVKHHENSINYRDIFPDIKDGEVPNCADGGVMPTIAGITGCVQATETVKYLAGLDGLLENKLFIFDAKSLTSYTVNLPKRTSTKITELPESDDLYVEEISLRGLDKLADSSFVLIDVRSSDEHNNNNIGGINIPMEDIDNNLNAIDPKKEIVFYCASGVRSLAVAKKVKKLHPKTKIASLKDGINS